MSVTTMRATFLHSTLADDPDLAEIVQLFVEEMPGRIDDLCRSGQAGDWGELARLAHQIKGAGGSYGFHALTAPAAALEIACGEEPDEAQIMAALDELVQLCRLVRTGE